MADRTSLPACDVDHRGIHHWRLGVGAAIQRLVGERLAPLSADRDTARLLPKSPVGTSRPHLWQFVAYVPGKRQV